jgi:hypothetical protein
VRRTRGLGSGGVLFGITSQPRSTWCRYATAGSPQHPIDLKASHRLESIHSMLRLQEFVSGPPRGSRQALADVDNTSVELHVEFGGGAFVSALVLVHGPRKDPSPVPPVLFRLAHFPPFVPFLHPGILRAKARRWSTAAA